jgi:hypothetical protein
MSPVVRDRGALASARGGCQTGIRPAHRTRARVGHPGTCTTRVGSGATIAISISSGVLAANAGLLTSFGIYMAADGSASGGGGDLPASNRGGSSARTMQTEVERGQAPLPRMERLTMYELHLSGLETMKPGEHPHLDASLDAPPAPGALAWLTIMERLAQELQFHTGAWAITLPLGTTNTIPDSTDRTTLIHHCDPASTSEPPYLSRLSEHWQLNSWEGELYNWKRQIAPTIVETISFNRSLIEADEGEPYWALLMLEISGRSSDL